MDLASGSRVRADALNSALYEARELRGGDAGCAVEAVGCGGFVGWAFGAAFSTGGADAALAIDVRVVWIGAVALGGSLGGAIG